MRHKQKLHIKT